MDFAIRMQLCETQKGKCDHSGEPIEIPRKGVSWPDGAGRMLLKRIDTGRISLPHPTDLEATAVKNWHRTISFRRCSDLNVFENTAELV